MCVHVCAHVCEVWTTRRPLLPGPAGGPGLRMRAGQAAAAGVRPSPRAATVRPWGSRCHAGLRLRLLSKQC